MSVELQKERIADNVENIRSSIAVMQEALSRIPVDPQPTIEDAVTLNQLEDSTSKMRTSFMEYSLFVSVLAAILDERNDK